MVKILGRKRDKEKHTNVFRLAFNILNVIKVQLGISSLWFVLLFIFEWLQKYRKWKGKEQNVFIWYDFRFYFHSAFAFIQIFCFFLSISFSFTFCITIMFENGEDIFTVNAFVLLTNENIFISFLLRRILGTQMVIEEWKLNFFFAFLEAEKSR